MSTNPDEVSVAGTPASHEAPTVPPVPSHDPYRAEGAEQPVQPVADYGQHNAPNPHFEQSPDYGAPASYGAPYVQNGYSGVQAPYQPGYNTGQPYYGAGVPQGYPSAFQQGPSEAGSKDAATSLTMGIIAAFLGILIGWIPFFGLLGVAGGVGLGIPAILTAKSAERNGVDSTWGKALGWVAIGFSILWVFVYTLIIFVGITSDHRGTSSM